MNTMQIFYEEYIVTVQGSSYSQLASVDPKDFDSEDFLQWVIW